LDISATAAVNHWCNINPYSTRNGTRMTPAEITRAIRNCSTETVLRDSTGERGSGVLMLVLRRYTTGVTAMWVAMWQQDGKRRKLQLGRYPDLGLSDARAVFNAKVRDVLAVDEKEIREHEYVAQSLVSKLGDLGRVRRGPRGIMELGSIVHFHTPFEVDLSGNESPDSLVRRLHPTPALGPLPRTSETLEQLIGWRRRLGSPDDFGAPFGAIIDGEFHALVAIRGVWWNERELLLPAGCGVIEASRLVNEWRELRLKREAVKARFGF
jgi:hypothetical protein